MHCFQTVKFNVETNEKINKARIAMLNKNESDPVLPFASN